MTIHKTRFIWPASVILAAIGTGSAALGWLNGARATGPLEPEGPGHPARPAGGDLSVYRAGRRDAILTQNARPDARPYLRTDRRTRRERASVTDIQPRTP